MNLMQTRAIVETGIAIGGKSVYEHNEGLYTIVPLVQLSSEYTCIRCAQRRHDPVSRPGTGFSKAHGIFKN